jgi:hypothetical protein
MLPESSDLPYVQLEAPRRREAIKKTSPLQPDLADSMKSDKSQFDRLVQNHEARDNQTYGCH